MNVLLCATLGGPNQYIELLAEAYQRQGHPVVFDIQNLLFSDFVPDLVHVQWPEAISRSRYQPATNEARLKLLNDRLVRYSNRRVPIVCTVHNMLPHENVTDFDRSVYDMVFRFADVLVHHGKKSINMVVREFPQCADAQHIICSHGPYPRVVVDGQKARAVYSVPQSKYVFLSFGLRRQYKGFDFTKQVFKRWSDRSCYLFTIGPKFLEHLNRGIIRQLAAGLGNRVESRLSQVTSRISRRERNIVRPVPNEEIPEVMAATDVLFLGHRAGLNSGLAVLGASYGKPVVLPDLGNFKEHLSDWPWHESYQAGNVDSAVEALERMRARIEQYPPGAVAFDNTKWLDTNSWDKHVWSIVQAVQGFRSKHEGTHLER